MTDLSNEFEYRERPREPHVVTRMRKLRAEKRFDCRIYSHAVQDGFEVPCTVTDISAGGARILFDALSTRSIHDKPIVLDIPEIGRYPAMFRWRAGDKAGIAFTLSAQNRQTLKARLIEKFDPE